MFVKIVKASKKCKIVFFYEIPHKGSQYHKKEVTNLKDPPVARYIHNWKYELNINVFVFKN